MKLLCDFKIIMHILLEALWYDRIEDREFMNIIGQPGAWIELPKMFDRNNREREERYNRLIEWLNTNCRDA